MLLENGNLLEINQKTQKLGDVDKMVKNYRNDAHVKMEKAVNVKAENIGIRLSYGNIKLEKTDKQEFMIWSITSEYSEKLNLVTCPLATENCKKLCYAKKAERMYPSVNARRTQNLEMSLQPDFVDNMIEQIEFDMKRKKFKNKEILFRIHEAGDFYSLEYMEKWVYIANHFRDRNQKITFMAYTKSLPFVGKMYEKFGKENVNITFKSSIWDDTSKAMVKLTEKLGLTVFTACKEEELTQNKDYSDYFKCPSMADIGCGTCVEKTGGCYDKEKTRNTVIVIH